MHSFVCWRWAGLPREPLIVQRLLVIWLRCCASLLGLLLVLTAAATGLTCPHAPPPMAAQVVDSDEEVDKVSRWGQIVEDEAEEEEEEEEGEREPDGELQGLGRVEEALEKQGYSTGRGAGTGDMGLMLSGTAVLVMCCHLPAKHA